MLLAVGGVNGLLATHKDPPKPLCGPTVSVSPSVAGRGTDTRMKDPHGNNLRCGVHTLCHGGVPHSSARAETAVRS